MKCHLCCKVCLCASGGSPGGDPPRSAPSSGPPEPRLLPLGHFWLSPLWGSFYRTSEDAPVSPHSEAVLGPVTCMKEARSSARVLTGRGDAGDTWTQQSALQFEPHPAVTCCVPQASVPTSLIITPASAPVGRSSKWSPWTAGLMCVLDPDRTSASDRTSRACRVGPARSEVTQVTRPETFGEGALSAPFGR